MTTEIFVGNSDIAGSVTSLSISSTRVILPSCAEINFETTGTVDIENGNPVKIIIDGVVVFCGFVFTITCLKGVCELICYDQIRYLMNEDDVFFENKKASEILKFYINKFELNAGQIDDTEYVVPSIVETNMHISDVLNRALKFTTDATGGMFVLFDQDGSLHLRNLNDMNLNIILSDKDSIFEYRYVRSINHNVFTSFKAKNGWNQITVTNDDKVEKWGTLQTIYQLDEQYNEAQIKQILKTLAEVQGDEILCLEIECAGYLGLRAGNLIYADIPDIGGLQLYIVEDADHLFNDGYHKMNLKLLGVEK